MDKNFRVYLDLEYMYPGMTKESGRPTEKQKRLIVQIGAILFDIAKGKEVGSFDQLIIPQLSYTLPEFFVELTKITQEMVNEKGVDFEEGLKRFANFSQDYPIWIFDGDLGVLKQNCEISRISFPFKESGFTRVKPLLSDWGIDPDKYSSGTLYQAAGLQMNGHVHNALHDVRSMAAAIHAIS